MNRLTPGARGEPLPAQETVIRLCERSKDYARTRRVTPLAFKLTSEDEKHDPPMLSVFAETLTSPRQAWDLMGRRPAYKLVARLHVDDVRLLRPDGGGHIEVALDVVWDPLEGDRPGADGHAGITGLKQSNPFNRPQRKSLRSKLADLASPSESL